MRENTQLTALHYTWYHIKHYIILLHSISSYKVKPSSCVSKWTFDQIISLVLMTCCFTAYLNFRRLCIDFCANVFRTVCTCIAYLNQPKMFLLACCCHKSGADCCFEELWNPIVVHLFSYILKHGDLDHCWGKKNCI